MTARFAVTIILSTGSSVSGVASQEEVERMVASGRFKWPDEMSDHDKQRAVIETQLAFSIEKDTGVFMMAAPESGKEIMLGNKWIVGGIILDRLAQDQPLRAPIGFQFDKAN